MEKLSSFERVVGDLSETEKERILYDMGERFDDQVFEDLIGKEREKTKEELQIINIANLETNEIRKIYGLDSFDISPNNIHVVTEEQWPREKSTAFFKSMLQGVAIREKLSNISFMKTILHEMLHFKSYNSLQMTSGENPELNEYRLGLTVSTRDGKDLYFMNLNEAVTEELTKRSLKKLLEHKLFTNEIEQTITIMSQYPQAITDSGNPLFDEDTFYAEVQGSKSWRESVDRLFGRRILGSSITKISIEGFTYQPERKILNILIDKILERNSDKFQDREEVFEVFAKGMMTGNILPIGRLVDLTFGKGTLRSIGELDSNINLQQEFVNSL